jgi:hypothetical protein
VLGLIISLALFNIPAAAGTNGQEMAVGVHCHTNWTKITGYNQNMDWTEDWMNTPAANPYNYCSQDAYRLWHWWWGGNVTLYGFWEYHGGNWGEQESGSRSYDVPWYQDDYDWYFADVPE